MRKKFSEAAGLAQFFAHIFIFVEVLAAGPKG